MYLSKVLLLQRAKQYSSCPNGRFQRKKNIKTFGNAGLVDKYFPVGPCHTVNKLHILLLFLCILFFFFQTLCRLRVLDCLRRRHFAGCILTRSDPTDIAFIERTSVLSCLSRS